jgi:hypothetical protein
MLPVMMQELVVVMVLLLLLLLLLMLPLLLLCCWCYCRWEQTEGKIGALVWGALSRCAIV